MRCELDEPIPGTYWTCSFSMFKTTLLQYMCHGQKSRFFGDGKPPTFNRNPCNGYINPYHWVDDHPLLYGNNGSLDPFAIYGHICWMWHPPRIPVTTRIMNHFQDRESQPKPSFTTGILGGGQHPTYMDLVFSKTSKHDHSDQPKISFDMFL